MKTVKQLLADKGRPICSVSPDDSIYDALRRMADQDIGAVLVLERDALVGIFSERDYARKVALFGKTSKDMKVREVMTEKVFYVTPSCTVEEGMALMTNKKVRHLPVLEDNRQIIGIISIGDLVKETISQQQFIIQQLEAYING